MCELNLHRGVSLARKSISSLVAALFELLVIETEIVRDLMQQSDAHLFTDFVGSITFLFDGTLEDQDAIRIERGIEVSSFGERNAFVEPKQCFILRDFHSIQQFLRGVV